MVNYPGDSHPSPYWSHWRVVQYPYIPEYMALGTEPPSVVGGRIVGTITGELIGATARTENW
jgi:hypothetical protein